MSIDERLLDRILPRVEKPARYTGGEYNSIRKNWAEVKCHIALLFPEIYDLGMSNLGLAIIYDLLNRQPDVLAERAYAPWTDMEQEMRQAGIPLYGLESKTPLADFDLLGISLPYEYLYTNVLNMLELAGIPLLSRERDRGRPDGQPYPLVMAGGNACFNPEPMADFIDFFVIGDGEEAALEIARAYEEVQGQPRLVQLRRMAGIAGVYVPRFYDVSYSEDGTITAIGPNDIAAPRRIVKRLAAILPPPLVNHLLPYIDVVHNRAAIEIQRGCTRGCRFCQAGVIYRPVRERPLPELLQAVQQILEHTGYEEIGLLSLSSSDYSKIEELVTALSENYGESHLGLSLPSLRIESFSMELADKLRQNRKTGFTFAPEAATERLRNVINKSIPDAQLLEAADEVFRRGWQTLKLYFMIGQPTETDEDVQAIGRLAREVYNVGRRRLGKRAQVRLGVSTFVPKPHTTFQWETFETLENIRRKQHILREMLPRSGIVLNWNDPDMSLLEAMLTRGDRRMGKAIYSAFKSGAKFDAWQEFFKPEIWWEAFEQAGVSAPAFANRRRGEDEILPWEHIDIGVRKDWLWRDYQDSLAGIQREDCRGQCTNCGIITLYRDLREELPAEAWQCPAPVGRR